MPFGERAAGSGFQVLLESDRARFGRELDRRNELPRARRGGMLGPAAVVGFESPCDIGGQAHVVAGWFRHASQDVDEPQWWSH